MLPVYPIAHLGCGDIVRGMSVLREWHMSSSRSSIGRGTRLLDTGNINLRRDYGPVLKDADFGIASDRLPEGEGSQKTQQDQHKGPIGLLLNPAVEEMAHIGTDHQGRK